MYAIFQVSEQERMLVIQLDGSLFYHPSLLFLLALLHFGTSTYLFSNPFYHIGKRPPKDIQNLI